MIKRFKKIVAILACVLTAVIVTNEKVSVYAAERYLYLGGFTAGFDIDTEGVTVVGVADVITDEKRISPARESGIKVGDVILRMNDKICNRASDIQEVLNNYKEGYIVTVIKRDGAEMSLDVFPEKDMSGRYKLGVFLRDGLSGIGTVTYIKENGEFASLGHSVCSQNGKPCQVIGGKVYKCEIIGVNKGRYKRAGELKGVFVGEKPIGSVSANCPVGLYGKLCDFKGENFIKAEVGEAKIGKAKIYSCVNGLEVNNYDIEIAKVDLSEAEGKNLVIKITDKSLISITGGIVQGMSGSPIVQNGKIVGAVTHVFLNDATRGFGVAIDKMLTAKCG